MNAIENLRRHAGFDANVKLDVLPLVDALDQNLPLNASLNDVLRLMQSINVEMNGQVPSESFDSTLQLPRILVYTVQELIRILRQAKYKLNPDTDKLLPFAAWKLETAWLAVLAGDIDDIFEHITAEQMMI